jgi:hypothetical protein
MVVEETPDHSFMTSMNSKAEWSSFENVLLVEYLNRSLYMPS